MRRQRRTMALFAGGLALVLAACRSKAPELNFLIVVFDALRADHVGALGYPRDTTPNLDRLAARGRLFTHSTSQGSYTQPSVTSLFTSTYPSVHRVRDYKRALNDEFTTLAEALKQRGYATAAFMPLPALNQRFGAPQGFDVYMDDVKFWKRGAALHEVYESARKANREILAWLDANRGRRFFVYVHYRDVHAPYLPPPPYDTRYRSDGSSTGATARASGWSEPPEYMRLADAPQTLEHYVSQYDGEIRYTDERFGELRAGLAERALAENTVLFVTADHGEAFLEHGHWSHGHTLYEEEIHVPLLFVDPRSPAGGHRIDAPVQTIDIYPTILDLLGGPIPGELQGRSLVRTIEESDPDRTVFSEFRQTVAVKKGPWKLIYDRRTREAELYHLHDDPGETRNLAATHADVATGLRAEIEAFARRNVALRPRGGPRPVELDPDTANELKALGYVQ